MRCKNAEDNAKLQEETMNALCSSVRSFQFHILNHNI